MKWPRPTPSPSLRRLIRCRIRPGAEVRKSEKLALNAETQWPPQAVHWNQRLGLGLAASIGRLHLCLHLGEHVICESKFSRSGH